MDSATPEPSMASAVARVRASLSGMRKSDARVANVILADPEAILHMSVTGLATAADVAESTVVRACQRLGFNGFQDLKIQLARDLAVFTRGPNVTLEDPSAILPVLVQASVRTLHESLSTLAPVDIERAADVVLRAATVLVIGMGPSAPIAADAALRLQAVGVSAFAPTDAFTQQLHAGNLSTGDVMFAVSHSGATKGTLEAVQIAASRNATTIAITSFVTSPLTSAVDVALIAGAADAGYRAEGLASRLAHLVAIDALCSVCFVRSGARSEEAYDWLLNLTVRHSM